MPHAIRLAGPWLMTEAEAAVRVSVPFELPPAATVLERSFNRPANLGDETGLFVCVKDCGRPAMVSLDGKPLGGFAPGDQRLDVSGRLTKSHRLRVEVAAGDPATFQPATLEIVEPWDEWEEEADAA